MTSPRSHSRIHSQQLSVNMRLRELKAPLPVCASPRPQLAGLRSQVCAALSGPRRPLLLPRLPLRRTEGSGWRDAFPTLDLVVFLPGNTDLASSCLHFPLKHPLSPSSLFSPQGHCLSFECPSWRVQGPGHVLATQGGCCPTSEPPFTPVSAGAFASGLHQLLTLNLPCSQSVSFQRPPETITTRDHFSTCHPFALRNLGPF